MNWPARFIAWLRSFPPPAALSESTAHPDPVLGDVMGPLTASDLGRMGRASQLRTIAEKKAAKTAELTAFVEQVQASKARSAGA